MRTTNLMRRGRSGKGLTARRANQQWKETEPVGTDNINDDVIDDRFSHGYHNQDYSAKNFWPADKERENYRGYESEPTGFIQSQASWEGQSDKPHNAVGYGNENSQSVQDFYNMKYGSEGTDAEERFRNRKIKMQPTPDIIKTSSTDDLDIFEDVPLKNTANTNEFRRAKRPNIRDKR